MIIERININIFLFIMEQKILLIILYILEFIIDIDFCYKEILKDMLNKKNKF